MARYQLEGRKLGPYQVIRIRQMYREGYLRRFIAKEFRISLSSLQQLLVGSTYKDIR